MTATAQFYSLLAAIAMAAAFCCEKRIWRHFWLLVPYALQIAGYWLLARASWMRGETAATLVLLMCGVTLLLKLTVRSAYAVLLTYLCMLLTLVGCPFINHHGWVGLIPLLPGLGVMLVRANRWVPPLPFRPLKLRKRTLLDGDDHIPIFRSQTDNANRSPWVNAFALFAENVAGVALWVLYAWMIDDRPQLIWRSALLLLNFINYALRFTKVLRAVAVGVRDKKLPRRRLYMPKQYRIDWRI